MHAVSFCSLVSDRTVAKTNMSRPLTNARDIIPIIRLSGKASKFVFWVTKDLIKNWWFKRDFHELSDKRYIRYYRLLGKMDRIICDFMEVGAGDQGLDPMSHSLRRTMQFFRTQIRDEELKAGLRDFPEFNNLQD